jgi:hypothetical protein
MMKRQARRSGLVMGFDTHMIAGSRACSTSTRPTHPTITNQTSPHYAEALATTGVFLLRGCNSRAVGSALSTDGDVPRQAGSPMVDDQAVLVFLQHLDLVLSEALRSDEQQRLRRLTMTHALVMALLADPQELDQALRQAAARLAELDS